MDKKQVKLINTLLEFTVHYSKILKKIKHERNIERGYPSKGCQK